MVGFLLLIEKFLVDGKNAREEAALVGAEEGGS
jgi:hypothetical protein